jgi:hypothetical protein
MSKQAKFQLAYFDMLNDQEINVVKPISKG